ncbi:50S ribosomal protein L14e [Candidatus Woesearchaeota archaeon]|nr:50S ribosomal protein L14e [Candidatus Woesearchaeota archaeon]
MQMIEVGRICVKIAGRDARHKCVVVDILDKNYVLIDGDVRRKKCNVKHLESLDKLIKIKKGASHDTIVSEFKKLKLSVWSKKSKPKTEKPRKVRKKKEKPAEEAKKTKKTTKKETKPKKEALAEKVEKKTEAKK